MTSIPESEILPKVSIVINTLNRAALLNDAINGVFQLDYPHFELIVVNGPSSDHSEDVLANWRGKIKHLRCDVPNLSVSRNVGIAAASGDIVAFLDDDAVPHPKWLRFLTRCYADPTVGAAGGFTVDNTGVKWQVRKTICDRFGNAQFVDDHFDERSICFAGTPFYPSLLGTNSTFRISAIKAIGGFDHVFAYLLDETDVCLRLVDAGWQVVYQPAAMIFHQFAASDLRSVRRLPKTLFPSVVSKTYFINRHGQIEGHGEIGRQIETYREELFRANAWLADHGDISQAHRISLDEDVEQGTTAGINASYAALGSGKSKGDLQVVDLGPFLAAEREVPLRVALVSQGIPPENDAGIARWTHVLSQGLRDRGVAVHIITRSRNLPSRRFRDGIWYHHVVADPTGSAAIAARYALPPSGLAEWIAGVMAEIEFLKTFRLDLVSFPIWDVEALPVLDHPDVASVLSLHTTYKLARPFKREWNERIIYGRAVIDRVIAAEAAAMAKAPTILANSQTVIREIEEAYQIEIANRCHTIPHGTNDLLKDAGLTVTQKYDKRKLGVPLRVLFPARFELRKGYDLALKLAFSLLANRAIQFDFVGNALNSDTIAKARKESGIDVEKLTNTAFHGEVDRASLDQLYLSADVVMMPSRFESFGLVAIEALSAGASVIGLKQAALSEVILNKLSGQLFATEDEFVKQGSAYLGKLADDRNAVARQGEAAYAQFQEHYSAAAMAASVEAVYRYAIKAHKEAL